MPLPPRLPSRTVPLPKTERTTEVLANRFYVQKTLGSGNCGTALLVLDRRDRDGRDKLKVAKKIFVGNLQPDETVDANQEASFLRHLDHPNIVRFYDSFIEAEFFYIVTEYCEGGDLEERIVDCRNSGSTFPEVQILQWLIEILLALQYMHPRRILHRDLKTRNLFLRHNRIKVGDFGISRILIGTLDMASTFVGTPYYMSPEVLKHEGYNSKSDIWSVGCILYELVSLKRAFVGKTLMDVLYQITESSAPAWPGEYSDELADLFYRMLHKDPVIRPSAFEALSSPLVRQHLEIMKMAVIEKQQARDHREVVDKDVAKIASAVHKGPKMNELVKESDLKRFRYLPPRDRMRIEKQKKADEEAERMKGASLLLQKLETKQTSDRARERNDPYKSKITLGAEAATMGRSDSSQNKFVSRPFTTPLFEDDLVEEDSDDGTIVVGKSSRRSTMPAKQDHERHVRRFSADDFVDPSMAQAKLDRQSYARHNSLDSSQEVPEQEDRQSSDEELEQIVSNLENCLLQDDSLTDGTIVASDQIMDVFGPGAKQIKIKNLRAEAISNLGSEKFDAIYNYLKKTRFDDRLKSKGEVIDEKQVRQDLRTICSNSDLCAIVEQLLFLEMSGQ